MEQKHTHTFPKKLELTSKEKENVGKPKATSGIFFVIGAKEPVPL